MAGITTTVVANMALSHLAHGKQIAALDTENSESANACREFFEPVRKQVLREFPWPAATAFATLGLVANQPTTEWLYAYRLPSDCLYFRRILSGIRADSRQSRVRYRRARDSGGGLIYTDQASAVGEYTVDLSDVSQFDADLLMAFSLVLAVNIAPRLTAGDPFKLGAQAQARYDQILSKARADAANEEQPDGEPDSESIRARGQGTDSECEFLKGRC